MSIKKYLSLALLTGMSWGALAQTAIQGNAQVVHLSLSQAVDIALQHNLTVKSYELNLKNAELTYQQSKYNQLPSLGGNINQAASFGR